jgi:hypothetical protein
MNGPRRDRFADQCAATCRDRVAVRYVERFVPGATARIDRETARNGFRLDAGGFARLVCVR